jgi:hypothetical protein
MMGVCRRTCRVGGQRRRQQGEQGENGGGHCDAQKLENKEKKQHTQPSPQRAMNQVTLWFFFFSSTHSLGLNQQTRMTSFSNAMMEMGFERLTGMSVPASARSALAIDRDDTLWAAFRFLLQVREHHSDRHTDRHHFTPTPPPRKKKKKKFNG